VANISSLNPEELEQGFRRLEQSPDLQRIYLPLENEQLQKSVF